MRGHVGTQVFNIIIESIVYKLQMPLIFLSVINYYIMIKYLSDIVIV